MTRKEVAELLYRMKTVKDNNLDVYQDTYSPNNIITKFDGCDSIMAYSAETWYTDFESAWLANNTTNSIDGSIYNEGCLALDDSQFIFIMPSQPLSDCGTIYDYDIVNDVLTISEPAACASEFGQRDFDFIPFTGVENTCRHFDGKYFYKNNIVTFTVDVDENCVF